MFRRILIATGILALAIPTYAYADPGDATDRFERAGSSGRIDSDIRPQGVSRDASVQVMVELVGDPVAVVQAERGRKLSDAERRAVRDKLRKSQDKVARTITNRGGKVKSQMWSAYNGMRVQISRSQLNAVADLPEVAGVHAVRLYTLDNAVSVPYLGVPQVWQDTGYTGQGVKVAIIDTGIDYTHANFGGPGTTEAYEQARADEASPADPALFGPAAPRVKGGWDFVGDSYNADPDSDDYQPVPHPDPNPLDCDGHGSHVAGTTGGSGVLADGTTYPGPYDASAPSRDYRVGPGVAPQVDLYALRVFGCAGSTDVTTEAIDWAVANDMDVINMSLGSPFGRADDPSSVAATNAVGAGVVVVTSAGNSGPNPYITGAPGAGDGVIAVAAVDSTPRFPGALLSFSNGTSLAAINANDADLPSGPLEVVVLEDIASTDENESLGCSVEAFTANGVAAGGNQLAAATRGDCARAAKAIYGQQAGAAAVLQINTDPGYPPFEGDITSNPDNNEPYEVTIPFLGVRSTDRAAVVAAEGGTVTLTDQPLPNPSFTGYGSFSSSGPRTGDSAISPNVAAPGVAIVSTGVGTGNGAATISGTSMAAPHVAGVAALVVQAHPRWDSSDVASAIVTTADPEKVAGQGVVRGGVGLVDAAQAVATRVVVTGDPYRTTSGWYREPSLSFGFAEPSKLYRASRTLLIENKGKSTVRYTLSSTPDAASRPANITLNPRVVNVKPGKTARVKVTLTAQASQLGSSYGNDQFRFREVSGQVVLTSSEQVQRVPYLMVPRAKAKVRDLNRGWFPLTTKVTPTPTPSPEPTPSSSPEPSPSAQPSPSTSPGASPAATTGAVEPDGKPGGKGPKPKPTPSPKPTPGPKPTPVIVPATSATVQLTNVGGALDAGADFYTWGLSDRKDVGRRTPGSGFDLNSAGVQYLPSDDLLVFAINNHDRWSNAVLNEFDVELDTDSDGTPDWIVFSFDSGAVRTGSYNGLTEVMLLELDDEGNALEDGLYLSGFLATAPTDSSTMLLPVFASDLGITSTSGAFRYTVKSYSLEGPGADEFSGWASYDPFAKAIEDGQFVTVEATRRKAPVTVTAAIDPQRWAEQKPLGLMVVVLDNKSGAREAVLIAGK